MGVCQPRSAVDSVMQTTHFCIPRPTETYDAVVNSKRTKVPCLQSPGAHPLVTRRALLLKRHEAFRMSSGLTTITVSAAEENQSQAAEDSKADTLVEASRLMT